MDIELPLSIGILGHHPFSVMHVLHMKRSSSAITRRNLCAADNRALSMVAVAEMRISRAR